MKPKGVRKYVCVLLLAVGLLSMTAAGALWGAIQLEDRQAAAASAAVMDALRNNMNGDRASANGREPGLYDEGGAEADSAFGKGGEEQVIRIQGRKYIGYLRFPDQNMELPVLADWSYRNLRAAPARFSGSVPAGRLVIAGHNTRAHFHILHSLRPGDEIRFRDASGGETRFRVDKLETLRATEVSAMTSGSWDLTLFTCTYGGRARLAVRCKSV